MDRGQTLLAMTGLVAAAAGAVVLTRRGGGEPALYARRIAGVMLCAFGLALVVFAIGTRAG